jgi:hypothetical protein
MLKQRAHHSFCPGDRPMINPRAVKYRRLTLSEPDQEKAQLLRTLADEAERGVLFTADWRRASPPLPVPVSQ